MTNLLHQPDPTERIAAEFLSFCGHKFIYEPAGNVSPDFLVDDQIAVEVRRLNQNYVSEDGQRESLEEGQRKIFGKIGRLASQISTPIKKESWFLGIGFKRPIDDWRILKPKIRLELNNFANTPRFQKNVQITDDFEIDFFPASKVHSTFFVMAGCYDKDAGGWVIEEMGKNIQLCITEKAKKINRLLFPKWWLILVDQTGLGLDNEDYHELKKFYSYESSFDRITIVSARDCRRTYEVLSLR